MSFVCSGWNYYLPFDYFVIGGGSGGVRSARTAANLGARVGIAEERYWSGTCVNVGCVPKKLLAMGARYGSSFAIASQLGCNLSDVSHDWGALISAKDVEVTRLSGS